MKRNPINMDDVEFVYERDYLRNDLLVAGMYRPNLHHRQAISMDLLAMSSQEECEDFAAMVHEKALRSLRDHYYGEVTNGLRQLQSLLSDYSANPDGRQLYHLMDGINAMIKWCQTDKDDRNYQQNATSRGVNDSLEAGPRKLGGPDKEVPRLTGRDR